MCTILLISEETFHLEAVSRAIHSVSWEAYMSAEYFRDVTDRSSVCDQTSRPPVRGATYLERMAQSTSGSVLAQATRYDVCAMEPNMLCFCNRIGLLLRARGEVCLRDSLLEFRKEVLVKLQDLVYVLLYG